MKNAFPSDQARREFASDPVAGRTQEGDAPAVKNVARGKNGTSATNRRKTGGTARTSKRERRPIFGETSFDEGAKSPASARFGR